MMKLFEPKDSPMMVALFMSGNGGNAQRLLEREKELAKEGYAPYQITVIFTDNRRRENEAFRIADRFGLFVELHDLKKFCGRAGKNPNSLHVRREYFKRVLEDLKLYEVDLLVLAEYGLIITDPILKKYKDRIISIHHADLSIRDRKGYAKYSGRTPVRDAILDGEREIRSSTHIVIKEIDQGRPLLISQRVDVNMPKGISLSGLVDKGNMKMLDDISTKCEDKLRRYGDYEILPLTVEWISRGCFEVDGKGAYLNGKPIPYGYKMDRTGK